MASWLQTAAFFLIFTWTCSCIDHIPGDVDIKTLLIILAVSYFKTASRALLIGGLFYFIFWIWRPFFVEKLRITLVSNRIEKRKFTEAWRSMMSLFWYTLPVLGLVIVSEKFGSSKMYADINEYSHAYWYFSIVLFVFWYDLFFYWVHRAFHKWNFLMKTHKVHHQSINVSPLAAYSFSALEGFLIMLPFGIYIFVVPWYPEALFIAGLIPMFLNFYAHLGYELLPKNKGEHWLLKWIYSAEHHSLHHQRFDCNYGNIFTFWDKFMGTEKLIQSK